MSSVAIPTFIHLSLSKTSQLLWLFVPCSRPVFSCHLPCLGQFWSKPATPAFLVWDSCGLSLQHQQVLIVSLGSGRVGELMEGLSSSLLSGGDAHSVVRSHCYHHGGFQVPGKGGGWGRVDAVSSVQFKMVSTCSGKPISTPPRLSEVSPAVTFRQFQCWSKQCALIWNLLSLLPVPYLEFIMT